MTEEEARHWLAVELDVPRETLDRIGRFLAYLNEEAAAQNLVSRSTLPSAWSRHIVDSAQLLRFASATGGSWIDLGSGAGFPGLIVAALGNYHVTLVEERRKRIEFLTNAIDILGIQGRTAIAGIRAEVVPPAPFGVISARAFAPLDKLLTIGARFSTPETIWLLPKGRSAQAELDAVTGTWQGAFRLEPSVTDPDSAILVARNVRHREQR
jgi:16S rRNA (guanine527-N7)-methyltransferase